METDKGERNRIHEGERNRNRVEGRDSDRKDDSKGYKQKELIVMLIEAMTVRP